MAEPGKARWLPTSAVTALLILALRGASPESEARAQARVEVGTFAPEISLDRLGGGRAELESFRGRAVVVNFWATWCAPCREELPELAASWRAQQGGGLEILAVNLTDQERRKDVQTFVDRLTIPFPVLLDTRGKVRERYGLTTLPTTVFVDSGGIVRSIHLGPLTGPALDRGLASILSAQSGAED